MCVVKPISMFNLAILIVSNSLKEPAIRREAGVGFAIANSLFTQLPTVQTGISERLITLRIPIGKTRYATVISAYASTMTNPDQAKEELFYWVKRSKTSYLMIK